MAMFLWKGGQEPPDAVLTTGKLSSTATYTGEPKPAIEVKVAPGVKTPDAAEGGYKRPEETQEEEREPGYYSAILARASEKAAEMLAASNNPKTSSKTGKADKADAASTAGKSGKASKAGKDKNPAKKPETKVAKETAAPISPTPRRGVAPRVTVPAIGTGYGSGVNLAKAITPSRTMGRGFAMRATGISRHREPDGPIDVVTADDEQQRLPILMTLTRDSAALQIEEPIADTAEEPIDPPEEATVIRFPLSEEQQRRERFYQETGMTHADFAALLEPSWSIAEMLSPRCRIERLRWKLNDCRFDAEMAACKAKRAVRNFLYKRRPIPAKQ